MDKYFWLETYGCQMNFAESNTLEKDLLILGWEKAADYSSASLVIINTCSVRKSAEERIYGILGKYRALKKRKKFLLVLMGCMAEYYKGEMRNSAPHIDVIVGTYQKNAFIELIKKNDNNRNIKKDLFQTEKYQFPEIYGSKSQLKYLMPIMHGCNNYCSYCVVPYTRGNEVSRNSREILEEVDFLQNSDVREITLVGQNVNSYKWKHNNGSIDFPELLKMIVEKNKTIDRVRFITSHPKDFSEKLIDVISSSQSICNHIHLPLQHGSDRILRLMNRKYAIRDYLKLVDLIRKKIPDIALSTDILIGFPGETENDFLETIDVLKKIRFNEAFTYYYNRREGTKADSMGGHLPKKLKINRLNKIIEIQNRITIEKNEDKIGKKLKILVEGISKRNRSELIGRTEYNEMVVFRGEKVLVNSLCDILVKSISGKTLYGTEVG